MEHPVFRPQGSIVIGVNLEPYPTCKNGISTLDRLHMSEIVIIRVCFLNSHCFYFLVHLHRLLYFTDFRDLWLKRRAYVSYTSF